MSDSSQREAAGTTANPLDAAALPPPAKGISSVGGQPETLALTSEQPVLAVAANPTGACSQVARGSSVVPAGQPLCVRSDAAGSSAGPIVQPDGPTVISQGLPLALPAQPMNTSRAQVISALLGQRLEHFQLDELVGGGGMGVVFRATDTRLNRVVALKLLLGDSTHDADTVRRFQKEAQSAARLDHDNIARVYYVGQDRGFYFIVFEYIEGTNLRDLVARIGPLTVGEAINYTVQVADALAHAASREVVHRDIKPSNVLITPQGRAKLVDMGLARLHDVEGAHELTASGVTLGTFDYISPEQAYDPRAADVRSDIYSLGCTLYFMLTGRPPFPDGSLLQKLLQHKGTPPPDPRDLNADVPEQLSRIVRKMLAKEPSRRYPHPDVLIAELQSVAELLRVELPGLTARRISLGQRTKWMHLPWLAPAITLLIVLATLHFVWSPPENTLLLPSEIAAAGRGASSPAPGAAIASTSPGQVPGAAVSVGAVESGTGATQERQPDSSAGNGGKRPLHPLVSGDVVPPVVPIERPGNTPPNESSLQGTQSPSDSGDSTAARQTAPGNLAGGNSPSPGAAQSGTETAAALMAPEADPTKNIATETRSTGEVTMPPERAGVLVVLPSGDDTRKNGFKSVRAAVEAAKNGEVVELRFDGPREETPFKLTNLSLTIRAADGFHPVLLFRPTQFGVEHARSMISVTSGQLRLRNVGLELNLPVTPVDGGWAMFELRRGELQAARCVLTIDNTTDQRSAYHRRVSFLLAKGDARAAMAMMPETMPQEDATVRCNLQDCIVRGQATLLETDTLQTVYLNWENGLFSTSGYLLATAGGANPRNNECHVTLAHITANLGSGLAWFALRLDAQQQMPVRLQATDCIFLGAGDVPFLEQTSADPSAAMQRIAWSGSHNIYEGFRTFWKIHDLAAGQPPLEWRFDAWTAHWQDRESLPRQGSAGWRQLPSELRRSVHKHTPQQFQLDDESPAHAEASDGGDIGMDAGSLPALLPEAGNDSGDSEASLN